MDFKSPTLVNEIARRDRPDRTYVSGHNGLVGAAICRALEGRGESPPLVRSHAELDLTDAAAVDHFLETERPERVYMAGAKVGGIRANDVYPAEFIRDNLAIQTNLIHSAQQHGVHKLMFLGSSCIYPRLSVQPITEECLLTGPLEPSNQWYAIAKIAGIKMCQAYRRQYGFNAICAMPTNLYGPGDNFSYEHSHVLPALIRRIHEAKLAGSRDITVWGTGTPRREFLHVGDLATALLHLMDHYNDEQIVNVGTGEDVSIAELATLIARVIGYGGNVVFDPSKPDGTPRKLLDVGRIRKLGWRHRVELEAGIASTYQWFLAQHATARL